MNSPARQQADMKIGLIALVAVSVIVGLVFAFGPDPDPLEPPETPLAGGSPLLELITDAPTRRAVRALQTASPTTYAELDEAAKWALRDDADQIALSELVLQALFGEFRNNALTFRSAQSAQFQEILAGLSDGLKRLKAAESNWCEGEQIAAFLAQNDQDLVPALLAEFPYQSPQYDWAMDWMSGILNAAVRARADPIRHQRPSLRDEAILQQVGLSLASEQWSLALQIGTFANSEGVSFSQMKEAVSAIDVCDLGLAVETVSSRLPDDVRARIWADLMPETMVGNTPYVLWRVNDYFFIG